MLVDLGCTLVNVIIVSSSQSNCLIVVRSPELLFLFLTVPCIKVACVAGGVVDARNNVLTAESLKVSGEAARRMGRRTLKYRLHENHGFLNSPHTSLREKRIGGEKYARQSNVK